MMQEHIITSNTILYCRKWVKTVRFYKDMLNLPISFSNDWFTEFHLGGNARLSIADETRSSHKNRDSRGITLALEVDNIDSVWTFINTRALNPTKITNHPWNARVFHLFDPEGHRIEVWESTIKEI